MILFYHHGLSERLSPLWTTNCSMAEIQLFISVLQWWLYCPDFINILSKYMRLCVGFFWKVSSWNNLMLKGIHSSYIKIWDATVLGPVFFGCYYLEFCIFYSHDFIHSFPFRGISNISLLFFLFFLRFTFKLIFLLIKMCFWIVSAIQLVGPFILLLLYFKAK